jgi:hypothetical protein
MIKNSLLHSGFHYSPRDFLKAKKKNTILFWLLK